MSYLLWYPLEEEEVVEEEGAEEGTEVAGTIILGAVIAKHRVMHKISAMI